MKLDAVPTSQLDFVDLQPDHKQVYITLFHYKLSFPLKSFGKVYVQESQLRYKSCWFCGQKSLCSSTNY